jgi:hypothetical protein
MCNSGSAIGSRNRILPEYRPALFHNAWQIAQINVEFKGMLLLSMVRGYIDVHQQMPPSIIRPGSDTQVWFGRVEKRFAAAFLI